MFVRNSWYVAAWRDEVVPEALLARTLLNEPVVFFRTSDGRVAALEDRCRHRFAPLSKGRIEGDRVRCMYHGLVFDASGRCVEIPGQDHIGPRACVRSYPIVERDRYVWIWMGEAGRADPAAIPDCHWQDDPAWRSKPGYKHFAADYRLIVDNLLDFSHLSFVHANTLAGSNSMATLRARVDSHDWGLRITRLYPNDAMPPYAAALATFAEPVDRWQIYDWHILGNVLSMDSGFAPAGKGALDGMRPPESLQFHSVQALTPETERTTHYFWSYPHNFALDDPSVTDMLAAGIARAFEKDKAMIEAQQAVLDRSHDRQMFNIGADAAAMQVRARLRDLIAAEAEAPAAQMPALLTGVPR
jgi:phenylpropionate dioxygenase-like ring-hydroxylating dioxygenase large terminal subunit